MWLTKPFFQERLVGGRSVGGIGPHPARGSGLVEQAGSRRRPTTIDNTTAMFRLIVDNGIYIMLLFNFFTMNGSDHGLALLNLTVQRASRSL
jgi:hypothetical protein